jgi:ABC-2 type transport system permease protein
MRPECIIALKDLRLLMRDRSAAFFTFVFPLAVALFFGFVFGSGKTQPLRVAVWNGATGPTAAAFVAALGADDSFEVVAVPTREEGQTLVRRGRAAGLLAIPPDFDARADRMLSGDGPVVELRTDPSRGAETGLLQGKLYQIGFQTMFARFGDPAQMEAMIGQVERATAAANLPLADRLAISTALRAARSMSARAERAEGEPAEGGAPPRGAMANWTPIRIEAAALEVPRAGPANSFAISFLQGLAWALFGAVLSFSGSMADEEERGTLLRLLAAPIRPIQALLGKAGACFVTCVACELLLVGVGTLWFGMVVTSVPLLAAATVATAFAFTGVMMALASVFRTQGGAQGAARAILLVLAMVGGGTIPLMFMPPIVQTASGISPFKWAVVAAEGATWRAWNLEEMATPLAVLAGIGAVGATAAVVAMRRRLA